MKIKDDSGSSLLHLAVTQGSLNLVQFLLQKNSNPEFLSVPDSTGMTVLMQSAFFGEPNVFCVLLSYDKNGEAKKQRQGKDNNSLLHLLVLRPSQQDSSLQHLSALHSVLDAGVDVNQMNAMGETALHLASQRGNEEIVKALLDKNANLFAQDLSGETALHYACRAGKFSVAEILVNF
eukprot:TRINITY_DN3790_c0_g1_i1.p1 TRINITY_DN3790_c0_g1~~TRINITY_DN3790_c0_g1_i1.p1  ORF type:complete len:178 (+),score=51.05 TRINITY_DN3790_c0_g1_i1:251-784(+)